MLQTNEGPGKFRSPKQLWSIDFPQTFPVLGISNSPLLLQGSISQSSRQRGCAGFLCSELRLEVLLLPSLGEREGKVVGSKTQDPSAVSYNSTPLCD
jgi:hypothetical protein